MPITDPITGAQTPTGSEKAAANAAAERTRFTHLGPGRGMHPEATDALLSPSRVRKPLDSDSAAQLIQERDLLHIRPRTEHQDLAPAIEGDEAPQILPSLHEEGLIDDAEGDEPASTPAEDEGITSLSDLASALEISPEQLMKLAAATKIDGQEGTVTLGEALASYQKQGHITRTQQALSEERTKLQKEHTDRLAHVDTSMSQLQSILAVAREFLLGKEKDTDWDKLRAEDPTDFAGRYFDHQRNIARFNDAIGQHTKLAQERTEATRLAMQEAHKVEMAKLFDVLPQWADEKTKQADKTLIHEYGSKFGFTPEQLDNLPDHRQVLILLDAARYRALTQGKDNPLNKRGPTSKTHPNATNKARAGDAMGLTSVNLTKARARLKASGGRDLRAVADVLSATQAARAKRGR